MKRKGGESVMQRLVSYKSKGEFIVVNGTLKDSKMIAIEGS